MATTCDKKLVRSKSGLRIVPIKEDNQSPLIIAEPIWVPDSECLNCMSCKAKFDFFQRRHHCRRCGRCFCSACCTTKTSLPRMCFVDPVLHCNSCLSITQKENEFFDTQLKMLIQGAQFDLISASVESDRTMQFVCKLSSDHRFILFEPQERNPFLSIDPVELKRIEKSQIISSSKDHTGSAAVNGLDIKFVDSHEQSQTLQLMVIEIGSNRKQSIQWLNAMHRALKMLFQDRNVLATCSVLE